MLCTNFNSMLSFSHFMMSSIPEHTMLNPIDTTKGQKHQILILFYRKERLQSLWNNLELLKV